MNVLAMGVNGCPYKMVNGEWIPDEEARAAQLAREAVSQKRKDALIFACRSRVCTPEEMAEIEREGIGLFLHVSGGMSQNYKEEELERRLNDLLLQQFRLRLAAETASTTKAEG